jgi:regulator of protease activity HflC (stomatin/prohibitin superfamily)
MEILYILLALAIVLVILSIRIVEQNTIAVVEFLGRYNRMMTAGLNFVIPFLEQIRERVTLRQQNFAIEGQYPSKDKVIVTISTNLIYTAKSDEESIKKYVYVLENRHTSIAAGIENSLRTYIARETHEGILEKKEELAQHIKLDLERQFDDWGMAIMSFQITNVAFPVAISNAMSEVVASEQLRKAAENKGEAVKIQSIKEAEAEKERKRLQGEGIALEREAIATGFRESISIMKEATGQSSKDIMAVLTLTQYLDTLKSIGTADNSKVIFVDSNLNRTNGLLQELTAAMESGEKVPAKK